MKKPTAKVAAPAIPVAGNISSPFQYFPTHENWNMNVRRVLAESLTGGGDPEEVFYILRRLKVGDAVSWANGWSSMAKKVETMGDEALKGGHTISARDCFLRAASYYRSADFFLPPLYPQNEELSTDLWTAYRRSFQKAVALMKPKPTILDIPYEGSALYAYFFPPTNGAKPPYATLIAISGLDGQSEEQYFKIARAANERGIAVLCVDGPGQGSTIKLRNIKMRYDYEVPIGKAVDYLYTRKDVDRNKIVLSGASMGGYLAPRAAAFEKRIKALVIWGAMFDMGEVYDTLLANGNPETIAFFEKQGFYVFGTKERAENYAVVKKFTLKGVIDKITCPTLLIHGGGDYLVPAIDVQRTMDGVKGPKKLVMIPKGEPGQTHCQGDSIVQAHYHIFNWIEDTFKNKK